MPLTFTTEGVGEPKACRMNPDMLQMHLAHVHQLMRSTRYRNDHKDDWTPDMNRDCQGKVAAAMIELSLRRVPLSAMRGYVVAARTTKRGGWVAHAVLVVRHRDADGAVLDYVLDHLQDGRRTLVWMLAKDLYRNARPALMAVEANNDR